VIFLTKFCIHKKSQCKTEKIKVNSFSFVMIDDYGDIIIIIVLIVINYNKKKHSTDNHI
jgi:hypothetical protein